ncbi:hypothetical protein C1H46_016150 [Malus baccata]|uniref:Uncharacterized protein n=1 Tax=Malus baccata TaxID=106549 RepID=A0A540MHG8_MALBA|nr:hypothetical protein C1H46_016150 [Malus baccata]
MWGRRNGFYAFWVWVRVVVQGGNSSQPWDLISRYNNSGRLECKMVMRAVTEKQWVMDGDGAGSHNELIQMTQLSNSSSICHHGCLNRDAMAWV